MTIGIWILGDQLYLTQAALQSCNDASEVEIILIESYSHIKQRPYHKQKLVLIWSGMRHFAEELRQQGYSVTYEIAEDFHTPLESWVKENQISELRVMTPNDKPFLQIIENLKLPCDINLLPNNQFLWSQEDFNQWAKNRKRLLMEDFYREGRRRFDILMEADKPVGGKWNLDKQNRKPPKGNLNTPEPLWFEPDKITQEVMNQVNSLDIPNYGEIKEFRWGVTRSQALEVLQYFIEIRLPDFGPYQDAMVTGEETMWHAMLSPYINIGLLQPLEIIQAAEQAYEKNQLPLNSVEGFIRQILGWREYMHGVYHHVDVNYSQQNWFEHNKKIP